MKIQCILFILFLSSVLAVDLEFVDAGQWNCNCTTQNEPIYPLLFTDDEVTMIIGSLVGIIIVLSLIILSRCWVLSGKRKRIRSQVIDKNQTDLIIRMQTGQLPRTPYEGYIWGCERVDNKSEYVTMTMKPMLAS